MYWAEETRINKVADIMSRNRWEFIKSNVHLNDNLKALPLDNPDRDRLYKVCPIIDHMKQKFLAIPMLQMLSVDEQIVPFKGRSSLKTYNPKKPVKWGYKIFVMFDSHGLVHDFMFYAGTITTPEGLPDLGATINVVLHLTKAVPHHSGHLVYFDNWFSSL